MFKRAKSEDEKLFYLGSALETLRGTFFRQAHVRRVRAARCTTRVDAGESLSGERLTEIYMRDPASAITATRRR